MPEVVGVVQARMGSTRLPGKVLFSVAGDTVLGHVLRRLGRVRGIDRVVVATTTLAEDDALVAVARTHGALVTRGSRDDVLGRYTQAFEEHGGEVGIRVTADCPCLDESVVQAALEQFGHGPADYLSNTIERSYPRGYDVEIFRVAALATAHREARDPHEREHVTPYLYGHPDRFDVRSMRRSDPLGTASWRLTLDTPEDWEVLRRLFEALAPRDPFFGLGDVEQFLRSHPEVLELNRAIQQKR